MPGPGNYSVIEELDEGGKSQTRYKGPSYTFSAKYKDMNTNQHPGPGSYD